MIGSSVELKQINGKSPVTGACCALEAKGWLIAAHARISRCQALQGVDTTRSTYSSGVLMNPLRWGEALAFRLWRTAEPFPSFVCEYPRHPNTPRDAFDKLRVVFVVSSRAQHHRLVGKVFACDFLDDQTYREFVGQVVGETGHQRADADAINDAFKWFQNANAHVRPRIGRFVLCQLERTGDRNPP